MFGRRDVVKRIEPDVARAFLNVVGPGAVRNRSWGCNVHAAVKLGVRELLVSNPHSLGRHLIAAVALVPRWS